MWSPFTPLISKILNDLLVLFSDVVAVALFLWESNRLLVSSYMDLFHTISSKRFHRMTWTITRNFMSFYNIYLTYLSFMSYNKLCIFSVFLLQFLSIFFFLLYGRWYLNATWIWLLLQFNCEKSIYGQCLGHP